MSDTDIHEDYYEHSPGMYVRKPQRKPGEERDYTALFNFILFLDALNLLKEE